MLSQPLFQGNKKTDSEIMEFKVQEFKVLTFGLPPGVKNLITLSPPLIKEGETIPALQDFSSAKRNNIEI